MDGEEERIIGALRDGGSLEEACRRLGVLRLARMTGVGVEDIEDMDEEECGEGDIQRLLDGWNDLHPDSRMFEETEEQRKAYEEYREKERRSTRRYLVANGIDPETVDIEAATDDMMTFDSFEYTPALLRYIVARDMVGHPAHEDVSAGEELVISLNEDPCDFDIRALDAIIETQGWGALTGAPDFPDNIARYALHPLGHRIVEWHDDVTGVAGEEEEG